jgi:bacterial/archaeal transporter family protein
VQNWQLWASATAFFAALTALLIKVGELRQLALPGLAALALSGVATGLSWFCYSRALQLGPVAGVAALDKLSVVLIALLALVLLGEQLDLRAWLGVLLMAVGAALVAWV